MFRRQCLAMLFAMCVAAPVSVGQMPLYQQAYRLDGDVWLCHFGWSMSPIDDVSGDGKSDLVIGAPGTGSGGTDSHVYLVEMTATGATVLARIDDNGGNEKLGWSVCGLDDVNGDGVPDYAAGAPRDEYVIWADGSDRTVGGDELSHPAVLDKANGPGDTHYFGKSVAALSNGQLLESSRPGVSGLGTSAIWYMPGPSGMEVKLEIEATSWGNDPAIRNVGDIVGDDGIDDFLISTDEGLLTRGRISVVSGAITNTGQALLADIEEYHFDGPADDTVIGDLTSRGQHPMAAAGDFTGDGVTDYVFTAVLPNAAAGAVYFYDGATQQMLWEMGPPDGEDRICGMVENVGDVDGDGEDDIAITAGLFGETGTVYFYSPTRQEYVGSLSGSGGEDYFGRSVLHLGDLNGDGFGDFAIGSPGSDLGLFDGGSVYVYTSVPEPATLGLLAMGGLAVLRRRKK